MTAPSLTGSITIIQAYGNEPIEQSVTVPIDATLCLVGAVGWYSSLVTFSALTLGGNALTSIRAFRGSTSGAIVLLSRLVNPPTGSQTLYIQFSNYFLEGANIFVAFLKDVNTSAPITDSDEGDADTGSPATAETGSFSSTANDLCLCMGYSYNSDANAAPTGAGQTEVSDSTAFGYSGLCEGAVGTKAGVAGTTTMKLSGDYPTLVACSIAGTAAAGSSIKVMAGVAQASIKVAAGVAAASIKKVAGVANT